ncbi:MAG: helix-turn-helix domain-containing protein [Thermodesulfobacteriota bacterium]
MPLIRAAGVLAFARFLGTVGAGVEGQWERVGLSPRALFEPERLLPWNLVTRFVEERARAQGIDDLGLRVGQQSTVGALGMFGAAIGAARTLGQAFAAARDQVVSHNSAASYWVVYDGGSARICRRFREGTAESRQADLFTVALMTQLVRLAAGLDWTPSRVELQSTGSLELRDTGLLGDARIEVAQRVTSIELPRHLLSRPLATTTRRPSPSAPQLAAWVRSAPPRDFVSSLESLLAALLEAGRTDVVSAAEAAGMTVRSFQRRLGETGLTYSALLERMRLRMAIRMLETPDVSMIEIALALGYSDAAHFTRAFRRWTSTTPMEYRRLLLRADASTPRSA